MARGVVWNSGLNIEAYEVFKGGMQVARAFEWKRIEDFRGIFVMGPVMSQFLGVGKLGSFGVNSVPLLARRGVNEVNKIWAVWSIFVGN